MKRAYGHEPILLDASPVTSAQNTLETAPKKWRKQLLLAIFLLVIVAGAVLTARIVHRTSAADTAFPAGIVQGAQFDLYSPTWLPSGWTVDRQSFDATAEVVTFTVSDARNKRLVITEQPKPPQPNLDTFYQQQLSGSRSLDVPVGRATLGQFEGSTLAGIATDQTWVLVRAVASVEQSDFEHIVRSLKKSTN